MSDWSGIGEVAVIECLTTGHNVELDRIVGLAAVLVDLRNNDDLGPAAFEALLDPRIPIPGEATLLHGVAGMHVAGRRHFGQIAQPLHDLIGDRPVVGFNVRFAARFLDAEMRRHGQKTFYGAKGLDVQGALYNAWGYRPTLSNAVTRLGVSREGTPQALGNAIATARLARILTSMSPAALSNAAGDRWVDEHGDHGAEPATRPQLAVIRDLGGDPSVIRNKRQAAEAIDVLRPGPLEHMLAVGENSAESAGGVRPGSEWVGIVVLALAALAAWLLSG